MVGAHRRNVELAQPLGRRAGRHACERLRVLVERQHRDDGETRDAAYRLDGLLELGQVVERLHREEVDAAAFEHSRLLGECFEAFLLGIAHVAEWPDRAGDVDGATRHLARVTGELHARRVDLLQLLLEEVCGELAAVGAERIRLDQLGTGADEAEMEIDDAPRRAEVRLLGAAQARHGAGDQSSHATVGADRRPVAEPFEEARRHEAHTKGLREGCRWGSRTPLARWGTNGNVSCGTTESDGGLRSAVRVVRLGAKKPFTKPDTVCMIRPPIGEPDGEAAGSLRFR